MIRVDEDKRSRSAKLLPQTGCISRGGCGVIVVGVLQPITEDFKAKVLNKSGIDAEHDLFVADRLRKENVVFRRVHLSL